MTYLLDTALLSELVKRQPHQSVVAWVDAQRQEHLFISAITLGELRKGIGKLQDATRKVRLHTWLRDELMPRFDRHVLPIDAAVALQWGSLQGEAERQGRSLPAMDCLIAATARVHGLTVVTRNVRDLERCGASVLNPWES
ncbi:MAG TPA: type II toxin-antitoxin system VapC family toxin [Chloroflexota bacterium]